MSLILSLGTNLGDKASNLARARAKLEERFSLIQASQIYQSKAVDYETQPDFYNQVIEFTSPDCSPEELINTVLQIEREMGRIRDIPKGPRIIDIDVIFWDDREIATENLTIPHPRWQDRSFIVKPLSELKSADKIYSKYSLPTKFTNKASPI